MESRISGALLPKALKGISLFPGTNHECQVGDRRVPDADLVVLLLLLGGVRRHQGILLLGPFHFPSNFSHFPWWSLFTERTRPSKINNVMKRRQIQLTNLCKYPQPSKRGTRGRGGPYSTEK